MKKLSALAFILIFSFSSAQVSEFQKADSRYERKIKSLYRKYPKPNDERTKQEWLLTEEKISAYKNALDKISEEEKKMITDVPPPVAPKITKEAEYETGKASFQKLLNEAVDLTFLNFAVNPYKINLKFILDSKGNASHVKVKGNNEDVNAFIEAAFYRIRDKGKWKPAESNGRPVLSVVNLPLQLNFSK
ncbi:hypothetical protein B0A69_09220 [Chryseobacterium shigense]|uniref:TonB protein C-terminal n=1 Tax=Chryseobacterium shigense TaxID=297244 RepID=A0A1N7IG76_9FLAO|nr:hypothetical protein [Chryseobacterium shigense]PQA94630.1 hypothetical protein B0A69_09220 [Chryseobacterium shigense]SIS36026.1 hypothetical protein SAMN05421639_103633 [Chryseobacterium shigense]